MTKTYIIKLIKEIICYEIIVIILLLIANKIGLTTLPIIETSICLTIGWIISKIIMLFIYKNKKNKLIKKGEIIYGNFNLYTHIYYHN